MSEPGRAGGLLGTLAEEHGAHEITTTRARRHARATVGDARQRAAARARATRVWRVRAAARDRRPARRSSSRPSSRSPWPPASTRARAEVADSLYGLLGASLRPRRRLRGAVPRGRRCPRARSAPARAWAAASGWCACEASPSTRAAGPFDCFQQVYPAAEVVFSISGQTARHVFRGADLRDWSVAPVDGVPTPDRSVRRSQADPSPPTMSLKGGALVRCGDRPGRARREGRAQSQRPATWATSSSWHWPARDRRRASPYRWRPSLPPSATQHPAPIFICFIPMLGIAWGYQRLNAWQPSAGRHLHLGRPGAQPARGLLRGLDHAHVLHDRHDQPDRAAGHVLPELLLQQRRQQQVLGGARRHRSSTSACSSSPPSGIKLSARFQWVWAVFEYALMIGFAIAALVLIYITGPRRAPCTSRRRGSRSVAPAASRP